jgi:hypothetical protein
MAAPLTERGGHTRLSAEDDVVAQPHDALSDLLNAAEPQRRHTTGALV